jgi:peptidoglycan hydrolase-like protein with peptidoglycan-binding domain
MPEKFKVNATGLHLRSTPSENSDNILATLPNEQIVEKLADSSDGWWQVSTVLGGKTITGYVASRYLSTIDGSLEGIVANDKTLTFDQLKLNKPLVSQIQKKLRNLGLYPGGQWIDGLLGDKTSRTWKGIGKFCTALGLSSPTPTNAINPALAQALLDKKQIQSIFDQANNTGRVLAELTTIQSGTPVANGKLAFLERTIKNSPFEQEIKNFPTYLARQPDGTNLVSYGKTFTLAGSGATVSFDDFPALGSIPSIDGSALSFLDSSIESACVCVGSFVPGDLEVKTHWLGKLSLVERQFLSSTKFIGVLNAICQVNKTYPNTDIDNCVIGGFDKKRYSFPALVESMLEYSYKFSSSNEIAAMFKRFETYPDLEDWITRISGNQGLKFRGVYGQKSFIPDPYIIDITLPGNNIVLKAAPDFGKDSSDNANSISAYDLVRLISMLGWHLHLPKGVRLPDTQWISLESVVRTMGVDTARYIDIALETLGLVNVVSEPVIISKMGGGNSALTYVAFISLIDNRQVPAKLRTLAMALWAPTPRSDITRDNNLAAAVTEIIRRVFSEELA